MKLKQANFCPAIGLSSSNKSTYLVFSAVSRFSFFALADFFADIIILIDYFV